MVLLTGNDRVFMFLQGPHGPFFSSLAKVLRKAGATVWRVGFNAGDQAFWRDKASYIPYLGSPSDWEQNFAQLVTERQVTDIVLYGDTRPIHAKAIKHARQNGLRVHVFEEGYMRPYWITYERGGANGHSRLMQMSVDDMRNTLENSDMDARCHPPVGAICASTSFTARFIMGSFCSRTDVIGISSHIAASASFRNSGFI